MATPMLGDTRLRSFARYLDELEDPNGNVNQPTFADWKERENPQDPDVDA